MASFLPTPVLGQARLACKALEKRLYGHFSQSFFAKKQFMLTERSLQTLIAISEHPDLSQCLKHLVIGLDHFDKIDEHNYATPDAAAFVRYQRAAGAQRRLLTTGKATELLVKALNNLKNLGIVDIRDFSSSTRFRDPLPNGRPGLWNSYGASTLATELGYRLKMMCSRPSSHNEDNFANRVFDLVFNAVAISTCRPHTIQCILKDKRWGLADSVFDVDNTPAPSMRAPVLTNLKTLFLDLSMEEHSRRQSFHGNLRKSEIIDPSNTRIRHFLSCTPNLTWLRLNFQANTQRAQSLQFVTWLAVLPGSNPSPHKLPWFSDDGTNDSHSIPWDADHNPPPVAMPLEHLDLGGGFNHTGPVASVGVTSRVMQSLFNKFANLKVINLIRITIYPTRMSSDADPNDRVNLWASLFRSLAPRAPKLQSLGIRELSQGDHGGQTYQVTITPAEELRSSWSPPATFSTQPMFVAGLQEVSAETLRLLADSMRVAWPAIVVDADEASDNEGSDSSDDDDMLVAPITGAMPAVQPAPLPMMNLASVLPLPLQQYFIGPAPALPMAWPTNNATAVDIDAMDGDDDDENDDDIQEVF